MKLFFCRLDPRPWRKFNFKTANLDISFRTTPQSNNKKCKQTVETDRFHLSVSLKHVFCNNRANPAIGLHTKRQQTTATATAHISVLLRLLSQSAFSGNHMAKRKPITKSADVGAAVPRNDTRCPTWSRLQPPPRLTRFVPEAGPVGLVCDALL